MMSQGRAGRTKTGTTSGDSYKISPEARIAVFYFILVINKNVRCAQNGDRPFGSGDQRGLPQRLSPAIILPCLEATVLRHACAPPLPQDSQHGGQHGKLKRYNSTNASAPPGLPTLQSVTTARAPWSHDPAQPDSHRSGGNTPRSLEDLPPPERPPLEPSPLARVASKPSFLDGFHPLRPAPADSRVSDDLSPLSPTSARHAPQPGGARRRRQGRQAHVAEPPPSRAGARATAWRPASRPRPRTEPPRRWRGS